MPYPLIRKAEPQDYETVWSIWMQQHVIQWMSFPWQTKEDFQTHYRNMQAKSDIYVLIDKIENEEKIVAVRRIKFGKNEYSHSAEYCSMGVDKDAQGKGYAKFFYQEFEKIVRELGIKRIQLTQSGGNEAAFHLTDKEFSEEAVFPDWLKRSNNESDFYLIERYIYRLLDKDLAVQASKLSSLKYQEIVPAMQTPEKEQQSMTIQRVNNQFMCKFQDKPLLTVDLDPDDSVIQHIGFLSIQLHSSINQTEALIGLRKILMDILEEGRVKKLELFTADPAIAALCKESGFFVRGEKIASCYDKEGYKNELGVEYSFFNITDAKKLITAKISEPTKKESIDNALSKCSETIQSLINNKVCDKLAAQYLENLTYQMVRDSLGPNRVFSLSEQPWTTLLSQTPSELHNDLVRLSNRLNHSGAAFFKKDKTIIPSEQPLSPFKDLT